MEDEQVITTEEVQPVQLLDSGHAPLSDAVGDVPPVAAPAITARRDVVCDNCGYHSEIVPPHPDHIVDGEEPEIRWQCNNPEVDENGQPVCRHLNIIPGHAGIPGEGALNPAASALTDEQIIEAAQRRGLTEAITLQGVAAPTGAPTGSAAPGGTAEGTTTE